MRSVTVAVMAAVLVAAASSAARAEILVTVDKSAQRMTVKRDGVLLYNWPVSTGRPGYSTPSGSFTAFRMEAEHFSQEWDDAPMPYSIFFTKIGHAIHGTNDTKRLGAPVSHGCVRLSPDNAATLYAMVEREGVTKMKVMLSGNEQVALARRGTAVLRDETAAREPQGRNQPDAAAGSAGYIQRDPWGDRLRSPDVDANLRYRRDSAQPTYPPPGYGYGREYPPYPGSYPDPRRYGYPDE